MRYQAIKITTFVLLCIASHSMAVTNQFRGVNWADPRDNFQSGVLYLSGLSSSDNYQSASIVADKIVSQFVSEIGSNSLRLPINEATIADYWDAYTGVIDMALTKGRVILCYWSYKLDAKPRSMDAFWAMWQKVVDKYGNHPNCYFEVFNEPAAYNKSELTTLYADWIKHYPSIPHGHIILDGTNMAWNVPDIGSDARFKDCLLAVHDYSFFASFTTEQQWRDHVKGFVGAYSDRTVMTEFGTPMTPGTKNGKYYDTQDYNSPPGSFFVAYFRGMTAQLREWKMGSFYWIGLRDNDWYSITKKTGSGADIVLSITNQSGLDRIHYAWTDTVPTVEIPKKRTQFYNGDFSEGTNGWIFNVWQGTGTGTVNKGQYEIDVSSAGTNTYSIQVLQNGLILEQGKHYLLEFDAYASSNRSIEVIAQLDSTPWTRYFAEPQLVALSDSKKTYEIKFEMLSPTDSNSRISFNGGLDTGKFFIDNVSIQEDKTTQITGPQHIPNNWSLSFANATLSVTTPTAIPGSLELLDLNGKLVQNIAIGSIPAGVSLYHLHHSVKQGVYIVRFRTGQSQMAQKIFLPGLD